MSRLAYLNGLAEGAALCSDDSAYELTHLQDTLMHIDTIAKVRHLDPYLCSMIALGHDLGRTKVGVYGKGHAKASAKWMKKFLESSDLKSKEKRLVTDAIRRHNKKNKIHGIYDEAIKDADTLAHFDEQMMDGQGIFEQYRLLALQSKPVAVYAELSDKWQLQLEALLEDLAQTVRNQTLFEEDSGVWVHRIRILSRKLRSILWVLNQVEGFGNSKKLKRLDKKLKTMAHLLSRPRLLHVACVKIGEQHAYYAELHLELTQCYETLMTSGQLETLLEAVEEELTELDISNCEAYALEITVQKMLDNYLKDVEAKKLFKPSILHKLRISGKRIVYLSDLELIQLEPAPLLNAIYTLHRLIGRHRDLYEMESLLHEKTCPKTMKELEQAISAELFLVKKIQNE